MELIAKGLLDGLFFEREIERHKIFYVNYLLRLKAEKSVLMNEINNLTVRYDKLQIASSFVMNNEYYTAEREAEDFFKKYWKEELISKFNAEVKYDKSSLPKVNDRTFWTEFFSTMSATYQEENLKRKAQLTHKINFLSFLRDCLSTYGLHKSIQQRDQRIYKRFNLIVWFKDGKSENSLTRILVTKSELELEYLNPFYKKKEIFVNGAIIKAKAITQIQITTTQLWHEDELELFAHWKGFRWSEKYRDEESFAHACLNETNKYLKNPAAAADKTSTFKNGGLTFINQLRIEELKSIKSQWDTSRLIQLCSDLNKSSTEGVVIGVAAISRAIINYVPPIFGFKNFEQVVAQYSCPKSIKSSLEKLQNSLKNIADYNLHAQAAKADSLPNMTTVDFSNDLDVLVGEVCKVLKNMGKK